MGRFFGWIGPVAYLLTVALLVACGYALCAGVDVSYHFAGIGQAGAIYGYSYASNPLYELGGMLVFTPAGLIPIAVWFVAILWFVFQAAIMHPDKNEDERWTSHMLTVGFVGRLVLMPLSVLLTVAAAACVASFAVLPGPAGNYFMLNLGLWLELLGIMLVLPFTLYQLCAVTRLGNRGLMGSTGVVWHAMLSFLPTVGFVSMCGLFVNGRESLIAAHDRRVAEEAKAETETGETTEDASTPGADGGETPPEAETAGATALPVAPEAADRVEVATEAKVATEAEAVKPEAEPEPEPEAEPESDGGVPADSPARTALPPVSEK